MNDNCAAKDVVNDIFREEALLIDNLATDYEMKDDLIWALCRNLDLIRLRSLKKYNQKQFNENNKPRLNPHPAVRELLRKIKER
jgi:hypothetical protein